MVSSFTVRMYLIVKAQSSVCEVSFQTLKDLHRMERIHGVALVLKVVMMRFVVRMKIDAEMDHFLILKFVMDE